MDFEKSIVRTVNDNLLVALTDKPASPHQSMPDQFLEADADGHSDGSYGEKSLSSQFGLRSVGMYTTTPSSTSGSGNKRDARNPIWWGSRHNQQQQQQQNHHSQQKQQQNAFTQPWKQATKSFQSQIRDIEKSIGCDVESLMSNMKQLAEEAQVLESEIGREELSSEYLLSSTEETKSELVDHLSSILMMKEANPST
jgi:hypothetical protein